MKINVTAGCGMFNIHAECASIQEANDVIAWTHSLEAGEERQAIVMADKPAPAAPPPVEIPFDAPPVTIADAVAAVKDYAARTNPAKARELMQQAGISRTNEITEQLAGEVFKLFKAAA